MYMKFRNRVVGVNEVDRKMCVFSVPKNVVFLNACRVLATLHFNIKFFVSLTFLQPCVMKLVPLDLQV